LRKYWDPSVELILPTANKRNLNLEVVVRNCCMARVWTLESLTTELERTPYILRPLPQQVPQKEEASKQRDDVLYAAHFFDQVSFSAST
jgi:hypothetical protein